MGNNQLWPAPHPSSVSTRILLVWLKRSPLFSPLCNNLLQEISSYFPTTLGHLFDLQPHCIRQFDFATLHWQSSYAMQSPILVHSYTSRWVTLGDARVFCCGGSQVDPRSREFTYWRSAYIVSAAGNVSEQAEMLQARECHGLTLWKQSVYVFGGSERGASLRSCEGLPLQGSIWQKRAPMNEGRSDFNPCLYLDLIYLCNKSIQCFVPLNNCYLRLNFDLPDFSPCCVYVKGDVLVVHTSSCVVRFKVKQSGELLELSRNPGISVLKSQCSKPVVDVEKGVVFGVFGRQCWSFDMKSGRELGAV